ncbi:MAG: TM1812 family CRISPR-associated protein [Thermotogae bacterium]|nr:TM1812 family CRISPR-associated protein [Thermotogota bacterium]
MKMEENGFSWFLVGFVGTGVRGKGYDEVSYTIDDYVISERFASIALAKKYYRVDPKGLVCLAFTPESEKDHKETIGAIIRDQLPEAEFRPILYDSADIEGLLKKIFDVVDGERTSKLIFDISNSFRSVPLVIFPQILFIKDHLKSVESVDIFYAKGVREKEFLFERLNTAAEIVEWSFAVKAFTRDGYSTYLSDVFHAFYEELKKGPNKDFILFGNFKKLSELFAKFHTAMRIADIQEIGVIARDIIEKIESIRTNQSFERLPYPWIVEKLLENMIPRLKSVAFKEKAKNNKVSLDAYELEREKRLAAWYLDINDEQNALQTARELIVNALMHCSSDSDWLSVDRRGEYERKLNSKDSAGAFSKGSPIDRLWDKIAQSRNFVSHCGIREDKRPQFPREEIERFLNSSLEEIFALFGEFLRQPSEHEQRSTE